MDLHLAPLSAIIDPDPAAMAVNAAVVVALSGPIDRRETIKAMLAWCLWHALPLAHQDARRVRLLASYDERIDAVLEEMDADAAWSDPCPGRVARG